jgi:hypothetical protein
VRLSGKVFEWESTLPSLSSSWRDIKELKEAIYVQVSNSEPNKQINSSPEEEVEKNEQNKWIVLSFDLDRKTA